MSILRNPDRLIGVICVTAALVILFLWIPFDTETGITEKIRRRVEIGDAMAPSLAAILLLLSGLLLFVQHGSGAKTVEINGANLVFLARLIATICIALLVMRYLGPIVVETVRVSGVDILEYRSLRDTAPWKYIGYVAGGTVLVSGLIALIQHRWTLKTVLIGALITCALALIYDLPFEDLLLPPNGDV